MPRAEAARSEADRAHAARCGRRRPRAAASIRSAAEATAAEGRAQSASRTPALAEGEAARVERWAHGEADRAGPA